MGGETRTGQGAIGVRNGPSPRGRGNRVRVGLHLVGTGSIPAWAGKPQQMGHTPMRSTVHPRVGGETKSAAVAAGTVTGPSPRGRGNQVAVLDDRDEARSIPAWAGKPRGRSRHVLVPEVHPRVGGETPGQPSQYATVVGPSPRGRGNHQHHEEHVRLQRSIPAWAGKPLVLFPCAADGGVHPRVGGETL